MWEIKRIIKPEANIINIIDKTKLKNALCKEPNTPTKTTPELEIFLYPTPSSTGLRQRGCLTKRYKRTTDASVRQAHSQAQQREWHQNCPGPSEFGGEISGMWEPGADPVKDSWTCVFLKINKNQEYHLKCWVDFSESVLRCLSEPRNQARNNKWLAKRDLCESQGTVGKRFPASLHRRAQLGE